jgi:hypothetical protein
MESLGDVLTWLQAIIEMVRELRKAFGEPRHGLVLANGGYVTHQNVVILSSRLRKDHSPYPARQHFITDWCVPPTDEKVEGESNIEVCSFPSLGAMKTD